MDLNVCDYSRFRGAQHEFDDIIKRSSDAELQKAEFNRISMLLENKEKQIDSLYKRNYFGRQVLNEVRNLYPQIIKCSYADSYEFHDTLPAPEKIEIIIFTMKDKDLDAKEKVKIESWLKARLNTDRIKIYYE